jgi:hypothetical protein
MSETRSDCRLARRPQLVVVPPRGRTKVRISADGGARLAVKTQQGPVSVPGDFG